MKDRKEIKALECCGNQMYSCTDKQCKAKTIGDAIDLIKRLQAEIEDLKESKGFPFFTNDTQVVTVNRKADGQYYADVVTQIQVDKIRTEAYKEFGERLKEKRFYCQNPHSPVSTYAVEVVAIDNLVKELTEVKDDEN